MQRLQRMMLHSCGSSALPLMNHVTAMTDTLDTTTPAVIPGKPAASTSAADLSYTLEPAFRRLLTLVQLTCVQSSSAVSLPAAHSTLLISPPGTGKTTFIRLLSSHYHLPLVHMRPVALSPASLASSFAEARRQQPSLLCMDDADQLLPRTSDDESWQHTLLSAFLDQLTSLSTSTDRVLLVLLCSTTAVSRLAPAVRSAVEVTLEASLPTAAHRLSLLQHFLSPLCTPPHSAVDSFPYLPAIVAECGGMSGADLLALVREAAQHALSHDRNTLTQPDFRAALQSVSASSTASGVSVKVESEARVGWDDVVGMQHIKREMQDCLIPLLHHSVTSATTATAPSLLSSLRTPPGLLLYGPPGTGQLTVTAATLSSVSVCSATLHESDTDRLSMRCVRLCRQDTVGSSDVVSGRCVVPVTVAVVAATLTCRRERACPTCRLPTRTVRRSDRAVHRRAGRTVLGHNRHFDHLSPHFHTLFTTGRRTLSTVATTTTRRIQRPTTTSATPAHTHSLRHLSTRRPAVHCRPTVNGASSDG